jgi:2-iminoacetate synthase
MSAHTFSSVYPQRDAEVRAALAGVRLPVEQRVEELLDEARCGPLAFAELAELLEIGAHPEAEEQFERLRAFALGEWRKPEGNRVRYVAPIYVSSYCMDTCGYCNFSALKKATARKRLSLEELGEEIDTVMAAGARVIELVYATDSEFTTDLLARYAAKTVEALRGEKGSGVLLCTEFLSREAYDALKDAGVAGMVQWDETLDREAYNRWHAASPRKRDFKARMDNHDRALAAGLEAATGALFGLADFRYDALMQVAKARHFASEYGHGPMVFGAARLKPIAGADLRLKTTASDRAWETALMVYRIADPCAGRWLQTREPFALNLRNLLDDDVFTYRCGEVTPGGYRQADSAQNPLKGGQFGVNELDGEDAGRELAARKFRIDYAWIKPKNAARNGGIAG